MNFVERTILAALSLLKNSMFAEDIARQKGLLQTLDPRVKAVSLLALIVLVLFTKNLWVLACIYGLCLVLAMLSRIRLLFFLERTWIFIPLFSLLIAIPALFSFVSPGRPLFSWGIWTITSQGLGSAVIFISRVITSVSLAVLLNLTTRHLELLKVLRIFGIPQMFVMILSMSYRYIFLFVEIMENTHRAVQSRVGSAIHYKKGQHLVAWSMAGLWSRSVGLQEQVHHAMLSRGFQGEPVLLHRMSTRFRDWAWLACVLVLVVCLWGAS